MKAEIILVEACLFFIFAANFTLVVAQLVRASVCGTEGHGFESHTSPE